MGWMFVVAIVLTLSVLGSRRWKASRRRRAVRAQAGRNPDVPLPIDRFDTIDATVSAARCHCGGRLSVISEGSLSLGARAARVVHSECAVCEEVHDFFFDLSGVTH